MDHIDRELGSLIEHTLAQGRVDPLVAVGPRPKEPVVEAMTGKVSGAQAAKRLRYALALIDEGQTTSNEGVASANHENAIRACLAAAEDMARGLKYMPKTFQKIHTAWKSVDSEANS